MQGMILAAGMGKRLKELTQDNTKCMVPVNGIRLIERTLSQLDKLNLNRIVIVIGYEGQNLIDFINGMEHIHTPIEFINNPVYYKTNNIYSLYLAKKELQEDDTLLLESDLIFEDAVLTSLLDDPRDTLALVDKYESWMDGTCMKVTANDSIRAFVAGKNFEFADADEYYKTVNIYKFSKHFSQTKYVPFLEAYIKALGENEYYEQVLRVISMLDDPEIKAKRLNGQLWYEIDDIQDLDIASSMFANSCEEQLTAMQGRYGGYWRYPKLIDYCYLVNPYYPPKKLTEEMKANFTHLLTQYPSGMRVNSLLASRNFGVPQDCIAVGNGAAELIKSVMDRATGKTGFIRPTFEEYPNRSNPDDNVIFTPDNEGFRYSADDIISFFSEHPVQNLVLINPDNPSGNYIPVCDLFKLLDWTKEKEIQFILDESFVDFADEDNPSLLRTDVLAQYNHLIVVKSISKSYGVPGLRLGVVASSDKALISHIKKDVAIWNINSFAEFYMQIEAKYHKDYVHSLNQLRIERTYLADKLSQIPGLIVYPSQANYLMLRLPDGFSSRALTVRLLHEHNILIKDLSPKIKHETYQYIRVAVRDRSDNEKLIQAMNEIMK